MALTFIEVERKTGVPSRRLRFWVQKGLFPHIERDKNGVVYFNENDLKWLKWVVCLRKMQMSISDLRHYVDLYFQGDSTLKERKKMIEKQLKLTLEKQKEIENVVELLQNKVKFYEEAIKGKKSKI